MWTPPTSDLYPMTATFGDNDSYYASSGETSLGVAAGLEQMSSQAQTVVPDYTMTIIGVGIVVIIAVAIAVAIAVLILRKRQYLISIFFFE